jgi:tetratricopeptide (TPR) repeat protein
VGENPVEWLQLLGLKFMLFVNAHEMWNNRSFSLSQQFSWVLRLPLLGFAVVGPLAMLGFAVTVRDWRRLFPLYGVVGVYLATCVMFFVLSRYRIPAVPVFVMFAAAALVWLYDALLARRATIAIALLGLVAAGLVVNQELRHDDLSVAYYNLGNKYRLANDHEKAIDQYRRSLAINVHYISAHNNLAISLEKSGTHREEAIEAWRRLRAMGMQRRMGRYVERAERHLRELDAI